MSDDILGGRRKALEEAFFAKHNEMLRQRLTESDQVRARRDSLTAISGITDAAVLDQLVKLDITPETLAALSLVPLIAVAWADGAIDARERAAVLAGAVEAGLAEGEASHQLLGQWLAKRPPAALLATWKSYIAAITAAMDEPTRKALQTRLLGRARAVAEAAGRFLGLGRAVSAEEEAMLDSLAQAFG